MLLKILSSFQHLYKTQYKTRDNPESLKHCFNHKHWHRNTSGSTSALIRFIITCGEIMISAHPNTVEKRNQSLLELLINIMIIPK